MDLWHSRIGVDIVPFSGGKDKAVPCRVSSFSTKIIHSIFFGHTKFFIQNNKKNRRSIFFVLCCNLMDSSFFTSKNKKTITISTGNRCFFHLPHGFKIFVFFSKTRPNGQSDGII